MLHFDAIVVGAGPAGTSAAYDLAAGGKAVLLIDRRRFPRVKPCAGGLTIKTLRRLRYSIKPVIREVCTDLVLGKRLQRSTTLRSAQPICAMTVRSEFDDFCLQRTIERGASFRVVRHINQIVEGPDGIALHTTDGVFHSRYLVGADGANSVVRRLLPAIAPLSQGFAIEAHVATDRPPPMTFDFGVTEFGYGWLFPKRDHVNVGLYSNSADVRPGREALADYARSKLGAARLEHVQGHHIGLRGWESAPPATSRVVLAGDAAGLVDPLLGEGIHNAVASGQGAAAAMIAAQATGEDLGRSYERQLRGVMADLRASYRAAVRFYDNLEIGYGVLTTRAVRSALVNGYARGLTFSATTRRFLLLPFLPFPLDANPLDAAALECQANSAALQ